MNQKIKTAEDVVLIREAGRRLAHVFDAVVEATRPGISIQELDALAEKLIRDGGDTPALLGYQPQGARRPFPATMCISLNEEVVHGIPNEEPHILKEGDLISFDCVIIHEGRFADMARTVGVGTIDDDAKKLMKATQEALVAGIAAARGGAYIGDIGFAIDAVAHRYGYGNVYELGGHGVGYAVHEEPYVMNIGEKGAGEQLVPGMVLALEPMFTEGGERVKLLADGYTYVTRDGSRSAHFEHTIVITDGAPDILTIT